MNESQEPKYNAIAYSDSGRVGGGVPLSYRTALVNRSTGEPIPDDEPVFVLRARDIYAAETLNFYLGLVMKDGQTAHRDCVAQRYAQFVEWMTEHRDRMKVPDSTEQDVERARKA